MRPTNVVLLLAMLLAAFASSSSAQSTSVVAVRYVKLNFPRNSSSTCVAVFPDRHFYLERNTNWPASEGRVFEGFLPDESFKRLSAILDNEGFKRLHDMQTHAVVVSQGEMLEANIPRGDAVQKLAIIATVGSTAQPEKRLPSEVIPLIRWMQDYRRMSTSESFHLRSTQRG